MSILGKLCFNAIFYNLVANVFHLLETSQLVGTSLQGFSYFFTHLKIRLYLLNGKVTIHSLSSS